ncbi:hypothetical protein CAS74_001889 [Pichia kudriavzevii]|uniref:non-specific serine/threonine protein kinase n=2 Tax=Pichia kudriavzevii TaxID=4909 RepID=A0A099NVC1_PICKU|nr:hypothetical protein JL09_g4280 [Pichia kudriavzevii]OUT23566.1 hypothetical protein CAS74_001889 [Pichia kudriavzevii]
MSRQFSAEQFQLSTELGRGGFGVVYLAQDLVTHKQVAIKQIDLETQELSEIQQEIHMLSTCRHPNITQYYGCFTKGYKLWIIMEYLGAGSCSDLLTAGPFSEEIISYMMKNTLNALVYLHDQGKIHRDIKAANILVGLNGEVKLADFGVATQLSNNMSKRLTFVGTSYWMAPEIINREEYSFKADIWSLGITAIEMAYGKPPFTEFDNMKVLFRITKGPPPSLDSGFSEEFKDFVNKCLAKEVLERAELKELVNHKFLKLGSSINSKDIRKLLEKKWNWDLETGNIKRNYYQPTLLEQEEIASLNLDSELETPVARNRNKTMKWDSNNDLDTLRETPKLTARSIDIVPQSPLKQDIHTFSIEQREKETLMRKEMIGIMNQTFTKITQKYNLSTSQYDQLVNFQTLMVNSFFNYSDLVYRDIFSKFYKLFVKRAMRSENEDLKKLLLPKYYLHEEVELEKYRENSEKRKGSNSNGSAQAKDIKYDPMEKLLLRRWKESMLKSSKEKTKHSKSGSNEN